MSPLPEPIRLLFDENLSARLGAALADIYPGSAHVGELQLAGAPDSAIWHYARQHGLVIVSKDEDFHRLSILYGPPPKSDLDPARQLLDRTDYRRAAASPGRDRGVPGRK